VVGGKITPTLEAPTDRDIARLWQEPTDIATRELFYGPGGAELMPGGSETFTFIAADRSGYSAGYDVRDANGLEWSGTQSGLQPGGRFRPKLPNRKVVGEWSWYENDFINTQPFNGLVVINVLLNNWDWKTSNNKIHEIVDEGQPVGRVHLVQDLGASLGKTSYPKLLSWLPMRGLGQGSRNDLEDFEAQGFIKRVEGDRVDFFYRGIHASLIEQLTRSDVVWTAQLMSRVSDAQWNDAFRAAGYSDDHGRRYVAKIKSKIDEGLKLAPEA
jgi:hypothetical protein